MNYENSKKKLIKKYGLKNENPIVKKSNLRPRIRQVFLLKKMNATGEEELIN